MGKFIMSGLSFIIGAFIMVYTDSLIGFIPNYIVGLYFAYDAVGDVL